MAANSPGFAIVAEASTNCGSLPYARARRRSRRSSSPALIQAEVAVEAGIEMSWLKLLGDRGRFVGMHSFGASGPAEKLYEHFGITAEAIAIEARRLLRNKA